MALFAELMDEASAAGELREDANPPRRMAAMTMQTIMFIAQSSGGVEDDENVHTPISGGDEVWTFCSQGGFARK